LSFLGQPPTTPPRLNINIKGPHVIPHSTRLRVLVDSLQSVVQDPDM
jgi:hypothetical protein